MTTLTTATALPHKSLPIEDVLLQPGLSKAAGNHDPLSHDVNAGAGTHEGILGQRLLSSCLLKRLLSTFSMAEIRLGSKSTEFTDLYVVGCLAHEKKNQQATGNCTYTSFIT